MRNTNPKVSIIIPVYNGSNYIAEAIKSALEQSYSNIEIIVVNDGSNDGGATRQAVAPFLADSKVKYVEKENGGVSSALNYGISVMGGEYFSWLSHDDVYDKNKIRNEIECLEDNSDVILCYGNLIDDKGRSIKHNTKMLDGNYAPSKIVKKFVCGYNFNGLGFLIKKDIFADVGLFDTNMVFLQDLDMWFRMLCKGYCFYCTKQKLVYTRIHQQQVSNLRIKSFYSEQLIIAEKIGKYISEYGTDKKTIASFYYLFKKDHNSKAISILKDINRSKKFMSFIVFCLGLYFWTVGCFVIVGREIQKLLFKRKGIR